MTSEEIIERLLDERKITVKEALVILKDLAKIGLSQLINNNKNITSDDIERVLDNPHIITPPTVVAMYACTPIPWGNNDNGFSYTSTSITEIEETDTTNERTEES